MPRLTSAFFLSVIAIACVTGHSTAQPVIDWLDPGGGDFQDPFNWAGSTVPTTGDDARFAIGGIYDVDFLADAASTNLSILDDRVSFDLGGFTYAVDPGSVFVEGDPIFGLSSRLTVTNGVLASTAVLIGSAPGTEGLLELIGNGATIDAGGLWVGNDGVGRLDILSGATAVNVDTVRLGYEVGSFGVAMIRGAGSRLDFASSNTCRIGYRGHGVLTVRNGGTWAGPFQDLCLGRFATGSATVIVDGPGTTLEAAELFFGEGGDASLTVRNGAHFTSRGNETPVAQEVTSTAEILATGPGTILDIGGSIRAYSNTSILVSDDAAFSCASLYLQPAAGTTASAHFTGPATVVSGLDLIALGGTGAGTSSVLIDDGAQVDGGTLSISRDQVTVTGPATSLVTGNGHVGTENGLGELLILDGASVESAAMTIGSFGEGIVQIEGAGAEWLLSSSLSIGVQTNGDGTLEMGPGTSVSCTALRVADDGGIGVLDVDDASFTSTDDAVVGLDGEGTLRVGAASLVAFGKHFEQTATGHLELTVSETGPTVTVAIVATLDGTIDVALAPGFTPVDGWSLDLITASTVSGLFATATLPELKDGPALHLIYHDDRVELLAGQIPGDANLDGEITVLDLVEVIVNWGVCPEPCPADLNDDGVVDVNDLNIVILAWDTVTGP